MSKKNILKYIASVLVTVTIFSSGAIVVNAGTHTQRVVSRYLRVKQKVGVGAPINYETGHEYINIYFRNGYRYSQIEKNITTNKDKLLGFLSIIECQRNYTTY
ncbi:hypothetical protein C3495_14625 (plasmid) [Clostridiaceae bacterium 14S0207]|nr:hypothetical protein C3495_14625 [Clostridiaceae bacterium 14S0207]